MAIDYVPTMLITGAKSGIGLEFSRQFADLGWNVIATHRTAEVPPLLKAVMSDYPKIRYLPLDVSDAAAIGDLARTLNDHPIDVLINNAAISYDASGTGRDRQQFGHFDPATFHSMFAINVLGPMLMAQEFAPHLRNGRHRKIISISSTNGSLTAVLAGGMTYYKASKAALNRAMIGISEVLRDDGIAVAMIHPGAVLTEKNRAHGVKPGMGLIETSASVAGMMGVIERLTIENTGRFYLYDFGFAPW